MNCSTTGDNDPEEKSNTPESISWSLRLLSQRSRKLYVILACAAAAGIIGLVGFRSPVLGLLGIAMIMGSTTEYWLGTSFKLDAKAAQARVGPSPTVLEWTEVKRVIVSPTAIKLSPLPKATASDAFRGVVLRTTAENHQAVTEFLRSHVPAEADWSEVAAMKLS